jgi:bifunctional non-homologous end joining protein LigD
VAQEVKSDGYRALAFRTGSEVQLLSRNRKLFNDNYAVLIDALKSLKVNFVIDGEIRRHSATLKGHEKFLMQIR